MNLAAAPQRAQSVSGPKAAARLYNDVESELALGSYSEEDSEAGEAALSTLESRFPGVRGQARDVTAPPSLSRHAKRNLDAGSGEGSERVADPEGENGPPAERRRSSSSSSSGRSGGRRSGGSSSRRSSSSGRRVVERAAGFSGDDVSGVVIRGLQLLLAAGVAYQVLQPKGSAAFSGVLGAIEGGFNRIVNPVDPLGSSSSSIQQGYAQAAAAVAASGSPPAPVVAAQVQKAVAAHPGMVNVAPGTPGATFVPGLGWVAPYTAPRGLATGSPGTSARATARGALSTVPFIGGVL